MDQHLGLGQVLVSLYHAVELVVRAFRTRLKKERTTQQMWRGLSTPRPAWRVQDKPG